MVHINLLLRELQIDSARCAVFGNLWEGGRRRREERDGVVVRRGEGGSLGGL